MVSCARFSRQDVRRRQLIVVVSPLLAIALSCACLSIRQAAADDGTTKGRLVSTGERSNIARLNKLIGELGDEAFAVREEATNQLIRAGIEAKPQLIAALSSADAEVRFRAKRVLEIVVEGDFQRRLKAFAEDVDGKRKLKMPGWSKFKELAGEDRVARAMFVEMQQAEPTLLEAYEGEPNGAAQALAERLQIIQLNSNGRFNRLNRNMFFQTSNLQPALAGSLAMLLIGGDESVPMKEEVAERFKLIQTPAEFRTALTSADPRSTLCRKILGRWIRRDVSESATYTNLTTALTYDLSEGLEPAVRMLKKGNAKNTTVYQAALIVGNYGDKEHLPLIAPLLTDNNVVFNGAAAGFRIAGVNQGQAPVRVVIQTQVRDIALAVTIKLSGQNPADFGFDSLKATQAQGEQKPAQLQLAQSNKMGFRNDDDRTAAFKKWEEWQKGQQQAAKEKPKSDTIER
jgi:hypothetical protein